MITVAGLKGSIMNIIDESEQLFSRGRTAMLEGNFKQAVNSYNQAIQLLNALAQIHRLASRNLPCARTWQTHIVIWPLAFWKHAAQT